MVRWQWFYAYPLAVKACRQRLSIEVSLGWPRADFSDRYGRLLTNRDPSVPGAAGTGILSALNGPSAAAATGQRDMDRYSGRPLATHLLGYVNPGDGRGAAGLEEALDDLLVQGPGRALASVMDGRGRPIPGLGLRLLRPPGAEPRAVRLTIDRRLQEEVEAIADRLLRKGAIVVMSPWNGEILAMASRPAFDPNHPEAHLTAADSPFINRAVTAYHPGSIFKLVVLASALENQPESFWRCYHDQGYLEVGSLSFRCQGPGHGELSLADALAFSCNTTFIQLGLDLGAGRLLATAERLGLGSPALQDLPHEDQGELPAALGLSMGDVANAAIGQRGIIVTPVQVTRLVAAIANGGFLVTGRVILGQEDSRGRLAAQVASAPPVRVIAPETARLMRAMMAGVVRYGTGQAASLPAGVGGKTGTAQTGQESADGRPLCHAWFAGFAPLARPEYVAVVFVEEGDSGGGVAAPIFRRVMQAALALRRERTGTPRT